MVLRSAIRGSAALLAVSISLTVGVFALAGPQRWIPLTEAEMAGHRGNMAERGKFTDTCNHYQAIIGVTGTWSCIGHNDGDFCDNCEVTANITYADMGGNPKNQKDGNAQSCGRRTAPFSAQCKNQVRVGNNWDLLARCTDPKQSVNQ